MELLDLKVSGMSCGHCIGAVTAALNQVDGVKVGNVAVGSASVSYDPALTSSGEIRRAIEDAGYPVSP